MQRATYDMIYQVNLRMDSVDKTLSKYANDKSQVNFEHAFSAMESLRTQVQSWGIIQEALIGDSIHERSQKIDEELSKIVDARDKVYNLRDTVTSLISPDLVSKSLSKSFSTRIEILKRNQNIWLFLSILMAILAIYATYRVMISIDDFIKLVPDLEKSSSVVVWVGIILRIGILFPIYSILVFCSLQYKQERSFEEEYANKAAVADSLPNYVGLAHDDSVKDKILSDSSEVIYSSPVSKKSNNKGDNQKTDITGLNDLLGNIQKILSKKTS